MPNVGANVVLKAVKLGYEKKDGHSLCLCCLFVSEKVKSDCLYCTVLWMTMTVVILSTSSRAPLSYSSLIWQDSCSQTTPPKKSIEKKKNS